MDYIFRHDTVRLAQFYRKHSAVAVSTMRLSAVFALATLSLTDAFAPAFVGRHSFPLATSETHIDKGFTAGTILSLVVVAAAAFAYHCATYLSLILTL